MDIPPGYAVITVTSLSGRRDHVMQIAEGGGPFGDLRSATGKFLCGATVGSWANLRSPSTLEADCPKCINKARGLLAACDRCCDSGHVPQPFGRPSKPCACPAGEPFR